MTDLSPAAVVERVFTEERARMLAALVRVLGDVELAEDALQDACALALRRWPDTEVTTAGHSEDEIVEIVEITVAAAIGPGLRSPDAGLRAVRGETQDAR